MARPVYDTDIWYHLTILQQDPAWEFFSSDIPYELFSMGFGVPGLVGGLDPSEALTTL